MEESSLNVLWGGEIDAGGGVRKDCQSKCQHIIMRNYIKTPRGKCPVVAGGRAG